MTRTLASAILRPVSAVTLTRGRFVVMPAAPETKEATRPCSNSTVAPARYLRPGTKRRGSPAREPRNARCRPGRRRRHPSRSPLADSAPAGAAPVPYLSHFTTVTEVASTVPSQRRRQPLRRRDRPVQHGLPGTRRHAGEQLQRQQQHPGHRHHHRGGGPVRTGEPVRPYQPQPARLPGRRRAHDSAQRAQRRLRRRRQPARSPSREPAPPRRGASSSSTAPAYPVETWAGHGINGPWDMTSVQLFGPFARAVRDQCAQRHRGCRRQPGEPGHSAPPERLRAGRTAARALRHDDGRHRVPRGARTPAPSSSARPGWRSSPTAPCTSPTPSRAALRPSPSPPAASSPCRTAASPSARAGASTHPSAWRWPPAVT